MDWFYALNEALGTLAFMAVIYGLCIGIAAAIHNR